MDNSTTSRCQYHDWWTSRRRLHSDPRRTRAWYPRPSPQPSLPPAASLYRHRREISSFDIEKALQSPRLNKVYSQNAPSICTASTSSHLLPDTRHIQEPLPLPQSRCIRTIRLLRYAVFTVYRRLFALIFVLNIVGAVILLHFYPSDSNQSGVPIFNLDALSTLASTNFALAVLVRQDLLVDYLFRLAWHVPWSLPVGVRAMVARVYCYGGIHSGAAVAGTLWWIVFTFAMSWSFAGDESCELIVVVQTWSILLVLLSMLILATPSIRARYHDAFEMSHRFLGWFSILLFWIQLLLLTRHKVHTSTQRYLPTSIATHLIRTPTFWNLTLITSLLIYPWLRLRRWTFTAHPLSLHALRLTFPNPVHKFSCLSISYSPLKEWHPFATYPSDNETGASIVISNAGDWTAQLIRDAHMRDVTSKRLLAGHDVSLIEPFKLRFWVKSHPKAGVLSLSCLFRRVLIVTTGSGIGPCLSSLLDRPTPSSAHPDRTQFARLVWSTRSPASTYGPHMLALVQRADPEAQIIDTDAMGRPNLLRVSLMMAREVRAEAVFVLSNERVTRSVVGGLERRGIRAFGPIWDS